jgi:crossover junction endodeoxyribonuclease RuvC
MQSIYVGLDLSLSATGYFIIKDDDINDFGEIKTKPNQFTCTIERVEYIADEIINKLKPYDVKFILLEDYFTGKQQGTVIQLAILGTIVRYKLLNNGYSFLTVAPTQIKKFTTGKGNVPKDNMLKAVFKNYNFDTSSNNIADACAIAYLGKAYYDFINGRSNFLKYELEVLKKVKKDREIIKPYKNKEV